MLNGFAYHEIVTDKTGTAVDYIFLEVNKAFESMTGLQRENIIGRRVTEVYPDIDKIGFNWIETYRKVALTGEPVEFEQLFEPQQNWYFVSAFQSGWTEYLARGTLCKTGSIS
ncbi:PAS domain-containing protein [candidate division KSB1 bacterium]|nr:PAS domain-containing protein [candidate division KSB1 bacterium]